MPGPILETLQESPLLLERYEWAGTITCVSATSFKEVMHEFKEAQAQLTQADLCVLTKTDLIGSEEVTKLLTWNSERILGAPRFVNACVEFKSGKPWCKHPH
jgi:G3E family GTPase